MPVPAAAALAVAAAALIVAPACGGDGRTVVRVSAAASLAEVFAAVEDAIEHRHPRLDVRVNAAGSSTIVAGLEEGAPADVVATADPVSMERLARGRLVVDPFTFATNRLVIAVARGNPKAVGGLSDLRRPGLVVALGEPDLPAGRYARQAFLRAGIDAPAATLEPSVTAIVTKIALGEVDAGVVYATDVARAGGDVAPVEIADDHQAHVRYLAAPVTGSGVGAEAVLRWLRGPDARRLLDRHGFGPAPDPAP